MALVTLVKDVAAAKNVTPAQVALAWLLAQRPWIVPIPGTTRLSRLKEDLDAVSVDLTSAELADIHSELAKFHVQGDRLPESMLNMTGL